MKKAILSLLILISFSAFSQNVVIFQNGNTQPMQFITDSLKQRVDSCSTAIQSGPKVYKALLNQSGTNAPVATVLENTLGNIVWSRVDVGLYFATLSGVFIAGKTFVIINQSPGLIVARRTTVNLIQLQTLNDADGQLEDLSIEIEVYQ